MGFHHRRASTPSGSHPSVTHHACSQRMMRAAVPSLAGERGDEGKDRGSCTALPPRRSLLSRCERRWLAVRSLLIWRPDRQPDESRRASAPVGGGIPRPLPSLCRAMYTHSHHGRTRSSASPSDDDAGAFPPPRLHRRRKTFMERASRSPSRRRPLPAPGRSGSLYNRLLCSESEADHRN